MRRIFFFLLIAFASQLRAIDEPLRVCLLSASQEYQSDAALRLLAALLEKEQGARCTLIIGDDKGAGLAGLEALEVADVLVLFTRRVTLPPDQLERVKRYCAAGKPILGLRTASHAFQNWLEFDREILGGDYQGHYGEEPAEVRVIDSVKGHPILAGVTGFSITGKLYKNPQPASDIVPLLQAASGEHSEIVAWVRQRSGTRIFYTSLGVPSDWDIASFRRLILNAVPWIAGRERPAPSP